MVKVNKPLISFALIFGLSACSGQSFPEAICERVNVTSGGNPVIGVEDMAYDAKTQSLYLSAYDRRAHSKGGIYRLTLDGTATNLTAAPVIENIRPHGIDLTRNAESLILDFIDRQGSKDDRKPVIRSLSWDDTAPDILTEAPPLLDRYLCASNDLVRSEDGTIFITQDHKSCTRKEQRRENIFSPDEGSVAYIDIGRNDVRTVHGTHSFPNGILESKARDRLYIAQTRKKRIVILHDRFKSKFVSTIELNGGPDNLTRDGDVIYASLIPSLIKFSNYQKKPNKPIKSRFSVIVAKKSLTLEIGEKPHNITTYDVPASVISGATIAIKAGEHIWLGAGYDTAIARCTLPESPL